MKAVHSLVLAVLLPSVSLAQEVEPSGTWGQFTAANGQDWQVDWSAATGTPGAIYGPGLKLDGPIADIDNARLESKALLTRFSSLLGKGESNFVEVIGVKIRQVYVFVYDQKYKGLDVISGRADVRINDVGAVAMFGSHAVQIPSGFNLKPALSAVAAKAIAEGHALGAPSTKKGLPAPRLVIWANTEGKVRTTATLAWEVQIDERPTVTVGKVYVDAMGGKILQFRNEVLMSQSGAAHVFRTAPARKLEKLAVVAKAPAIGAPMAPLTGKVMAWVNKGHNPLDAMTNVPLANCWVTSSSGSAYTDAAGNFSIANSGTTAVTVSATLTGRHTKRIRVAQGSQMSASKSIRPGTPGTIQFGSATMGVFDRAQTTTYWFTDDCNTWLRGLLPGSTGPMNTLSSMNPRVNLASSCNAYYTNFTINFYHESSTCNMTAYETVVQHEWGHGADHAFGGLTQTDGLSEGWGDTLCTFRSAQPIVGPNFRKNGGFVRTALNTKTYPAGGGVHQQGETWMGFNWDVRTNLIATHGSSTGVTIAEKIVIASIAADAKNQPNAVREVFILDDDDGNLNNGTPNYTDLEKAALKRKLPYPKRVNPNAGSYVNYGAGCVGSGKGNANCASNNPTGGTLTGATTTNEYAYSATTTTSIKVSGFSIYTRNTSGGNVTVRTAIYGSSNGTPSTTPIASGTMTIGSVAGFYRTTLSANIPAGPFWVSVDHSAGNTHVSTLTSGAGGSAYWRRPPMGTGAWARSGVVSRPSFLVHCGSTSGGIPDLHTTDIPEINQTFTLNLRYAKTNSPSLLLFGVSKSVWGALTLPFDLGTLAPGCKVLASGEAQVGFTTNAAGTVTQNFAVPNNPALVGVLFHNQYVVSDSAKPIGFVLSNAGAGKIGKQ